METAVSTHVTELEPNKPDNRSNDGKVDRQGGFWVSTMGKDSSDLHAKGAIYRWFKGELRLLYPNISIPNAICFTPDGKAAYFGDTAQQKIWRVALDAAGWPVGEPVVYLDFTGTEIYPDGSTVDLLPKVSQTIDWVRLPNRFPVRINVTGTPPIPLRIGQTVSVSTSH